MSKIITAAQAAELVQDGCTLTTTGFNGFGCPEDLMMALADHFDQTSHPKDVTLVKCTSQGDGKGRGVSHLAEKPGLFQELILSHMGYDPGLRKLVQEEKVSCFLLPLGNLMALFRAIAGGLPGAIATTGIGTFADPRNGGGSIICRELLAKDGELAAWMIGELRRMGYTEVNLNFGCPSGTVTAKGKGSGMLRDPQKLDAFLDAVFSQAGGPVSVKTRLGVARAEEFGEILNVYNKYPLCELTIHPRVMKQLYRGQADREAFAAYLPACTAPVCYNGDVTTVDDLRALEAAFPGLSGIMVGRGLIADPALLRKAVGGPAASREELRGYHDELYHGYTEAFGMASCAVSRMKAHWFYLIHLFNGADALEKPLRKAREGWEYETVVNQIFARWPK